VNSQPYWNVQFNQAINMPLNLLTTMGVIGLATWLFLAWRIVKMYKTTNKENRGLMAAVLAMLGLQLLLPANVVMLTIFGIALAILVGSEKHKHSVVKLHPLSVKITTQLSSDQEVLGSAKKAKLFSPFSAVVVVLIVGLVSLAYFAGRTYAAQVLMNESSKAVARNDVLGTYQKQQAAVRLNPYLDALRRRYAATNMLIAIAVSNKVDATQEDQNQVGQLLQQAIREARAATILDPGDVENWLTLAQIYQNMNGVADEAVDWTIQSYVSAIETSPADPTLRLSLGGIFLAQQDFNQAANFFQQSVALKPDFANGYYNLAAALKELGQLEQSKAAYQQVLVLIDTGSDDYTRVTSELEELEKQIAAGQDNGQADTEDESNTPSILNQNLENQAETVRQPNNDVDVNLESPAPAAEPSPNPASPGATLN
jgi:tetratricopeptide (TPR) repeat protein